MADPKGPESGQDGKGGQGARPRSPTLDLSATDVSPKDPAAKPAAAAPTDSKSADAGPAKSPSTTAAASKPFDPTKPIDTSASAARSTAGAGDPNARAEPAAASASEKPAATKSSSAEQPQSAAAAARANATRPGATAMAQPTRGGVGLPGLCVAALAGAALALLGVALFGRQLIGVVQPDQTRIEAAEAKLDGVGRDMAAVRSELAKAKPADTSAMETKLGELSSFMEASSGRVGAVETQLKALSEQAAKPTTPDPTLAVLAGRIDGLELRFQNAPTPDELSVLNGRISGIEARTKDLPSKELLADLSVRLDDLGQTVDSIGQKIGAATAPISNRVEQIATALSERPKGDPTARLVVALGALDQALGEGRPFAPELDAVKAAAGENAELKGLDANAAKGLPTREALGADLAAQIARLAPLKAAPSGSILERFVASAGGVIKVTPKDGGASGTDPAAVRARVAQLGSAGDLEGALGARGQLDEAARAATDDWAALASARVSAENAIGSARTAALARLTSND